MVCLPVILWLLLVCALNTNMQMVADRHQAQSSQRKIYNTKQTGGQTFVNKQGRLGSSVESNPTKAQQST